MRVFLREFKESDIEILPQYLNNPKVTQYLSTRIPQPYSREDAEWWIDKGCKNRIVRAIECEGVLVGSIGAERGRFERLRSAEIGYWIAESYWGKGIATVALRELSEFVFQNTDIARLQAHVYAGNTASARVLQKSGYELEGVLRKAVVKNGVFMDAELYALLMS